MKEPLDLTFTRPCAGHTGRATRRPSSYRGREDTVGKGAWDKDNNEAKTREQEGVAGVSQKLGLRLPDRACRQGDAEKRCSMGWGWGRGGRRRHAP